MSHKQHIFVANWKMYHTGDSGILFARQNKKEFQDLVEQTGHEVILCPSSIDLRSVVQEMQESGVSIGAQDCSDAEQGAYTGQISASMIKSAGASFCLVGHSETRLYGGQTDHMIAAKIKQLCAHGIIPILCIGEDRQAYEQGRTFETISRQLALALESMRQGTIYLAYEPVWAIGTGLIPSCKELDDVVKWLHGHVHRSPMLTWKILYGGSVSETSIESFAALEGLDGFLIGGASLHIQAFKKIVSWTDLSNCR